MSHRFMQFPFVVFGALVVMMLPGHAQDQSDFISIDCGLQQDLNYTDNTTTISYVSDTNFIDTGESKTVSREFNFSQQFLSVRIFPEGTRNCYKINIKSGRKYLIRASFGYGNYDGEDLLPEFELHLGANLWDSIVITREDPIITKEIIHIPMRNYLHVCLVDINKGVPFISTIELRRLRDESYPTELAAEFGSLALTKRSNMAASDIIYRYPDDVNDRIWSPEFSIDWLELNASSVITDENAYQLPSAVMSTAATPSALSSKYLNISWTPLQAGKTASYYIYMHFAEVEEDTAWARELTVTMNGEPLSIPFVPQYLKTKTINATTAAEGGQLYISIYTSGISYRSILNAYEIYEVKEFLVSNTNQQDVEAIANIKTTYKIIKNWQGDPCNPQEYLWEGVECSYSDHESSRITSLVLSSSGLTGEIADSIANLTMIQTLDLSNNNLSGQIPEFMAQFPKLNVLNLRNNELTGSVPEGLIAKRGDSLSFSLCGNPSLSPQVPCEEKKKDKFVVPVVVSIVVVLLVSIIATVLWNRKKNRAPLKFWKVAKVSSTEPEIQHNGRGADNEEGGLLPQKKQEVVDQEGASTESGTGADNGKAEQKVDQGPSTESDKEEKTNGAEDGEGIYDVFLSFRGPDTRNTVIGHLYEALTAKKIKTFLDDKSLKTGHELDSSLQAAIEASKIAIIMFSETYVTSSWCLNELVKILECKKYKQQRVFPFFYKVKPTDVRHQTGPFALDDEWIHKDNKNKIPLWKEALSEAANMKGQTYDERWYESDMIKDIVKEILKMQEEEVRSWIGDPLLGSIQT